LLASIPGQVRQTDRVRELYVRREKRVVLKALFLCHRNGRICVFLRHQEEEIVKGQRRCKRERENGDCKEMGEEVVMGGDSKRIKNHIIKEIEIPYDCA
jgi:hypothetical protein